MNENTIYKITCNVNGMVYIGSTTDYNNRVRQHLRDLKMGNHSSRKMQSDYYLYGIDSFLFEIINTNNDIRKEDKEYEMLRLLDPSILYNSHKGVTNMAERRCKQLDIALNISGCNTKMPIKIKKVNKTPYIKKVKIKIKITTEIREAIKEYRLKNNLSQYDLGKLMGYCDAVIGNIERKDEYISENKAKILQSVTGVILID